jgi:hypothetical protein
MSVSVLLSNADEDISSSPHACRISANTVIVGHILETAELRGACDAVKCTFLGAFKKLRKATVSFVLSVRPPVCLFARMQQLGCHKTDFHET